MPVPALAVAAGLGGLSSLSWVAFDSLYRTRRQYWKETGLYFKKASPLPDNIKISVVVPAYNEASNIVDCARAILECSDLGEEQLELIVVDDLSKDNTLELITAFQKSHERGKQLQVMSAGPRPENEVWLGKCWAVWQGSKKATGDYIVFVDADVRLKRGGLEKAISVALEQDCDLLSGDVAFTCSCFAERIIQPLVIQNLVLNNDHRVCNDDSQPVASAAGHIMIFKMSSYRAIEGHSVQGVRDHVVEDVMMAFYVKCAAKGTVRFYDFTEVAEIQMYDTWGELFEGYSKNIYLAHDQSVVSVLAVSLLNLISFTLPAGLLGWGVASALAIKTASDVALPAILLSTSSFCFFKQWSIRQQLEQDGRVQAGLWWTQPVGAVVLVAIAYVSLFKGVTGLGWTWKGRPLRKPEEDKKKSE